MTQILEGEIGALGYPGAALLAFGVALVSYNIYSTVHAALRAEYGVEKVQDDVSGYYIADEVQGTMLGMEVAVEPVVWEAFQKMSPKALAKELRRYARHVSLDRFKKHPRGPKKPTTPRTMYTDKPHVSTARLLAEARGDEMTLKGLLITRLPPFSALRLRRVWRSTPVTPAARLRAPRHRTRRSANR
jgi:hypothetical protein